MNNLAIITHLHILTLNLKAENINQWIEKAESSIKSLFEKDSKQIERFEKLKQSFMDAGLNANSIFHNATIERSFKESFNSLLIEFIDEQNSNFRDYLNGIKKQLSSAKQELDGFKELQKLLYETTDAYDWLNTVYIVFKEVYGPADEKTRSIRKILETQPEEGMPMYHVALQSSFLECESIMDDLIAKSTSKINEEKNVPEKNNSFDSDKPFNPVMPPTEKKHYTIGIGLFWGIAIPLAAGIFYFGLFVGTAKFDQGKIDLSNENRELKDTINKLEGQVGFSTSTFIQCENDRKELFNKMVKIRTELEKCQSKLPPK